MTIAMKKLASNLMVEDGGTGRMMNNALCQQRITFLRTLFLFLYICATADKRLRYASHKLPSATSFIRKTLDDISALKKDACVFCGIGCNNGECVNWILSLKSHNKSNDGGFYEIG
jgi:hypothetical protein